MVIIPSVDDRLIGKIDGGVEWRKYGEMPTKPLKRYLEVFSGARGV